MTVQEHSVPRTEADLIAAFAELGQRAPSAGPVWQAIRAATEPQRSRGRRRRSRWIVGGFSIAAVAAGTAVALMLTLVPGETTGGHGTTAGGQETPAHGHPARPTAVPASPTARQVLLLAAAHASTAPSSGNYWHLSAVSGSVEPAGTKAHPYDIVRENPTTVWYSRQPGQLSWELTHASWYFHAVPMTSVDQAAWRASGSPSGWYPNDAYSGAYYDRAGAVPQDYTWSVSDGGVGYIEGNLSGLSAASFAKMPTDVAGLRRYLVGVANSMAITKVGSAAVEAKVMDSLVWTEALNLLVDPVSDQVRASAYRVMAALPGVATLGLVRDPFGRQGYGLRLGQSSLLPGEQNIGAIIDPTTGALLDTNSYNPSINGTNSGQRVCHGPGAPANLSPTGLSSWLKKHQGLSSAQVNQLLEQYCPYVGQYYGRPYSGLGDYTAFFASGWVTALPHVPPATQANKGFVILTAD
jgi:hypothetical protein